MTCDLKNASQTTFEHFWFATFLHKTHLIHMTTSEESLIVLFFTQSLTLDLVHLTDMSQGPPQQIQLN
jgi:hypothetical protein